MCGFVGTVLPRSENLLIHRGPDCSGNFPQVISWANISVGMTRLSIVDRSSIKVPFDFRDSCAVILAYNGEVYNWRALKAALSDGSPWATDCDAEVVARAWRRWGPGMLSHLNGMFGLMLIDTLSNLIFIARDRAGEKPVYYTQLGTGLAIASEIKALPIKLEEGFCPELGCLEYDSLETTPFKGVKCLGPGEYILLKDAGDILTPEVVKWWTFVSDVIDHDMTWKDAVDETEALLVDAIKLRTACEVPFAVQLSGGLDSAIIQAVVKSSRIYTVTFPDDGVDNLTLACAAAQGVGAPVPVSFNFEDVKRELPNIVDSLDTPATWTACAQWFMNKKIADDGSVIVLSGEGADEIFSGYTRYRFLWWLDQIAKDDNISAYGPMFASLFGKSEDILARMLNRGSTALLPHAKNLVERFGKTGDLSQRMARVDFAVTLPVLLRMADRMSAAFSLENRSPFLDYRLMELGARMPTCHKITAQESKAVLREVARRLGVPASIVDNKTKKGLFIPWAKWSVTDNSKGIWDRRSFAELMQKTWRKHFFGQLQNE